MTAPSPPCSARTTWKAEILCDRVVLMDQGRVLADGTPERLGSLQDLFFRVSGRALSEADQEDIA